MPRSALEQLVHLQRKMRAEVSLLKQKGRGRRFVVHELELVYSGFTGEDFRLGVEGEEKEEAFLS